MSEIRQLLTAWGDCMRESAGRELGYRCSLAIIMMQNVGSVLASLPVMYEDVQSIDRVLLVLKNRKPAHYDAIELHYVKRLSSRQFCKNLHVSPKGAHDMLIAAEHWIDGAMSNSQLTA